MESTTKKYNPLAYLQTSLLNVHDVRGKTLNMEDLKKVIAGKGSLVGAKLAADLDVRRLEFNSVKVDRHMLETLINKKANVAGVDVSGQSLGYMDLTNVDLSGANCEGANFSHSNCTGTNFSYAILTQTIFTNATFTENTHLDYVTLNETTFIGVDLSKPSMLFTTFVSVIVSDQDREPYVNLYIDRLFFIVDQKASGNFYDPFYRLTTEVKNKIREEIMFSLSEKSLIFGETSVDKGPQDIVLNGSFDQRIVKKFTNGPNNENIDLSPQQVAENVNSASQKLLGNEFTDAQKILFHHARAAVSSLLTFDGQLLQSELIQIGELNKKKVLNQIYIEGREGEPRLVHQLMHACFDILFADVFKKIPTSPPSISGPQIKAVYELFMSPKYCWS